MDVLLRYVPLSRVKVWRLGILDTYGYMRQSFLRDFVGCFFGGFGWEVFRRDDPNGLDDEKGNPSELTLGPNTVVLKYFAVENALLLIHAKISQNPPVSPIQ